MELIVEYLNNKFPPKSLDHQLCAPIDPRNFVEKVLTPLSAQLLIQQDFWHTTALEAREIMKKSWRYGSYMHPSQDVADIEMSDSD
jgi:hypothetical protein